MSATVIKDFLVAIGFKSDSAGAKKMNDELVSVENRVKLLQQAFIGMATSIVGAVAKTSGEMEKLYYSSQRIGASAGNIRAFQGAISQMGGSAEGAMQSMEALAQKIRQSPGMEKMVQGIGVATREANGEMRDQVEMYKDFHKQLSGMDYYRANAYGNAFGWDENTLMAIRDPAFAKNLDKYQALQKSMGMNDDLAKSGKEFATEWRDLMMMSKALAEVIIMTAGEALIPVFKTINSGLQAAIKWFGNLDPGIKKFLATALKIGTLIVVFGGLFGAISKLARVLPILRGLIFLIRGLSLAFFMSPIGIVLALAAAIALLWNDYQVWKEGGKSLIDWKEWEPAITELVGALTTIKDLFSDLIAKAAEFAGMDITPETAGAVGTAAMTGIGLFGAKNILKRFPLIAAGMTGYEVGGLVNEKFVEGTTFGDKLGEGIAKGLAAVGVESAKEAVAMNEKNRALLEADAGNSVAQGADKVADNKVTETADKVSDKVTDKSLSQVATDIFSTVAQKGNEVRKEIESGLSKTVAAAGGDQSNPNVKSKGFNAEKGKAIAEVARRIGVDPNDLAAVISFETGGTFNTNSRNKGSSATGLIQFMSGSGGTPGKYYGMTRDEFGALPFAEQMKYVERYFKERGFDGSRMRDVADTYTAVTGYGYRNIPKYARDKNGEKIWDKKNEMWKRVDAYWLNRVWDSNKDGYIAKGEMVKNKHFRAHQMQYFEPVNKTV